MMNKNFLWYYIRHINSVKIHLERIIQKDKELANDLNYDGIKFPVDKEDFGETKKKNNICIYVFCYENKLSFSVYISDQNFENSTDFLLIINENKSHYV